MAVNTPPFVNLGDVLAALGGVPPGRVRLDPRPGTATELDWATLHATDDAACELVAGTLVEKPMGWREAWLATHISLLLRAYVDPANLGLVVGADGPHKLGAGLIRLPDVAFIAWASLPDDYDLERPDRPYVEAAPDLAVEVISESNTAAEMRRKVGEYFAAGVKLVWCVDPVAGAVEVYTSARRRKTFATGDTLTGGAVLPGFVVPVARLFDYPRRPARR